MRKQEVETAKRLEKPKTKDRAGIRDRLIGARLRKRRNFLGLSQSELGERIGMSFQQLQKYETGFNKISASRLVDICEALGVSVLYAYRDLVKEEAQEPAVPLDANPMIGRESVTLVSNYWAIDNAGLRDTVMRLVRQAAWSGQS